MDSSKKSKYQLFLLHFAGGSSYSFDFLKKNFESEIEFIALELPGRGKRFEEELLKFREEAINDYCEQILNLLNGSPFIIYGHSMGASLGYDVVAKLEKLGYFPKRLVVSGNAGPGVKKKREIVRYLLGDFEFKDELRNLGGIPEEVLVNKQLYDFFAPIMRADFECIEKKYDRQNFIIETPIYALMGSDEEYCDDITNWSKYTNSVFDYKVLKGNHFFIHEHAHEMATVLKESLLVQMNLQEI